MSQQVNVTVMDSKFSTKGLGGEAAKLVQHLQKYRLGISVVDDGIVDVETGKPFRKNHLKCIIRRDYLAEGGTLRGKELVTLIEIILKNLPKACKHAAKDYPQYVEQMYVDEGNYL